MADLIPTPTNTFRLHYQDPNKFKDIDLGNFKASIAAAKEAIGAGQDVAYAMLAPLMTVVGGSTEFDIAPKQDVATKRLLPLPGTILKSKEGEPWRASLDGIPKSKAQQIIINDKVKKLQALGQEIPTPEAVAKEYNAELPGTQYSDMLHETLTSIVQNPKNQVLRQLMEPLFQEYKKTRSIE